MKSSSHYSENPRLTAYALGELDFAEAAQVEAEIKDNPFAQEIVNEVRSLAGDLEAALASENSEYVRAGTPAWVDQASGSEKTAPFPFWMLTSAAAACFALVLAVHSKSHPKSPVLSTAASEAPAKLDLSLTDAAAEPTAIADLRRRLVVPDGFSDVKPAPFREDGLKLGKSVAATTRFAGRSADVNLSVEPSFRNASSSAIAVAKSEFSPSANYGRAQAASRLSALVYNREAYAFQQAAGFSGVAGFPLSVFSPSGATSSYSNIVSYIQSGRMPPPDSVRVEELLNYFSYRSPAGKADASLAASIEVAAAPWNPSHRLVRIGLTGRDPRETESLGQTIAKDLKLQVEFNPEQAKSYRLIGYDEAGLPKVASAEPAKVEGGDMEAGRVFTALYEVVPVTPAEHTTVDGDPLRYASAEPSGAGADSRRSELLTLKIHYKLPIVDVSRKLEIPLIDPGTSFAVASKDFKFSAAVARFGMMLKESPTKSPATYDQVLSWAQDGQSKDDKSGKQHEFIDLVKKARDATVE